MVCIIYHHVTLACSLIHVLSTDQNRIEYKVAVLTFMSRSGGTASTYPSRHIKARVSERTLRSSAALSRLDVWDVEVTRPVGVW